MINFQAQNVEAHRAGLGTFRPDSVTDGFLCIFRQEGLELCLGILVFEVRLSRSPKYAGNSAQAFDELMSTIRTASIRVRGGSTPKRRGGSPLSTHLQNFFSAVKSRC